MTEYPPDERLVTMGSYRSCDVKAGVTSEMDHDVAPGLLAERWNELHWVVTPLQRRNGSALGSIDLPMVALQGQH